jgi:hypothetical protein
MPQSQIPETVECVTMPAKSVKQKSEAMAKARKALKGFSGKLADPILFEQGPGLLGDMIVEREIAEKRGAKLGLLFAHYHIPPNDKDRWIKLSECLATDFVPGMIAIKLSSRKFSSLRKNQKWTFKRYSGFVRDVDEIRTKSKLKRIDWAIDQVARQQPEKWGRYNKASLNARYHEGKRIIGKRARVEASSWALWEPPKK